MSDDLLERLNRDRARWGVRVSSGPGTGCYVPTDLPDEAADRISELECELARTRTRLALTQEAYRHASESEEIHADRIAALERRGEAVEQILAEERKASSELYLQLAKAERELAEAREQHATRKIELARQLANYKAARDRADKAERELAEAREWANAILAERNQILQDAGVDELRLLRRAEFAEARSTRLSSLLDQMAGALRVLATDHHNGARVWNGEYWQHYCDFAASVLSTYDLAKQEEDEGGK